MLKQTLSKVATLLWLIAVTYVYMYMEYYSAGAASPPLFASGDFMQTITNEGVSSTFSNILIHLFSGGYIVSLVFVMTMHPSRRLLGCIALVAEAAARLVCDSDVYRLSVVIYWALHLRGGSQTNDDDNSSTEVEFRPYEAEIRRLLFTRCPEKLHLVDALLDRYEGDGEALLSDLKEEFQVKASKERESLLRQVVHK